MWAEASQWAVDQVDSVNVERLFMTKSKVNVWGLATEAFESCLGFYLNPEIISGKESAAGTIRRSKPVVRQSAVSRAVEYDPASDAYFTQYEGANQGPDVDAHRPRHTRTNRHFWLGAARLLQVVLHSYRC